MSAIRLSKTESWVVAGWVFDYLAVKVVERSGAESAVGAAFQKALDNNLRYVSVAVLSPENQRDFARVVAEVYGSLLKAERAAFATPEGYEGLKARIGELVEMITALPEAAKSRPLGPDHK